MFIGGSPVVKMKGAHTVYEIFPYYLFAYNVGADRCSRFTECTDKEVNGRECNGILRHNRVLACRVHRRRVLHLRRAGHCHTCALVLLVSVNQLGHHPY